MCLSTDMSVSTSIKNNTATNLWQCIYFSEAMTGIPWGKYRKILSPASLRDSSPALLSSFFFFHVHPNLSLLCFLFFKETGSHCVALDDLELAM